MPQLPENQDRYVIIGEPDFNAYNSNDAGDEFPGAAADIQPVANGENANQTVFRRPSENLRSRSELLRAFIRDLSINSDFDRLMLFRMASGTITWKGPQEDTINADNGALVATGNIEIMSALWPDSKLIIEQGAFNSYFSSGASSEFSYLWNLRNGDTLYYQFPRTYNTTSGRIQLNKTISDAGDLLKLPLYTCLYSTQFASYSWTTGDYIEISSGTGFEPWGAGGTGDLPVTLQVKGKLDTNTIIVEKEDAMPVAATSINFVLKDSGGSTLASDSDGVSLPDYSLRDFGQASDSSTEDDMPVIVPIATAWDDKIHFVNGIQLEADGAYPGDFPGSGEGSGGGDVYLADLADNQDADDGASLVGIDLSGYPAIEWGDDKVGPHTFMGELPEVLSNMAVSRQFYGCKGIISGFEELSNPTTATFEFGNTVGTDALFVWEGMIYKKQGTSPLTLTYTHTAGDGNFIAVWDLNASDFATRDATASAIASTDVPLVYYTVSGGDIQSGWKDCRLWVGRGEQVAAKNRTKSLIPGVFTLSDHSLYDATNSNHMRFGNFISLKNAIDYVATLKSIADDDVTIGEEDIFCTIMLMTDISVAPSLSIPDGFHIKGIGRYSPTITLSGTGPILKFDTSYTKGAHFENIDFEFSGVSSGSAIDIDLTNPCDKIYFENCYIKGSSSTRFISVSNDTEKLKDLHFENCFFDTMLEILQGNSSAWTYPQFTSCKFKDVYTIHHNGYMYPTLIRPIFLGGNSTDTIQLFGDDVSSAGEVTIIEGHGFGTDSNIPTLLSTGNTRLLSITIIDSELYSNAGTNEFIDASKITMINSKISHTGTNGTVIRAEADDCVINDCYLSSTATGLIQLGGHKHLISNNRISFDGEDSTWPAAIKNISGTNPTGWVIEGNFIIKTDNLDGYCISLVDASKCTIMNNIFSPNSASDAGITINLAGSDLIHLSGNHTLQDGTKMFTNVLKITRGSLGSNPRIVLSNNAFDAQDSVVTGTDGLRQSIIQGNTFTVRDKDTNNAGIFIGDSAGDLFEDNIIDSNIFTCVNDGNGIYLYAAYRNVFSNNTFLNLDGYGICVYDAATRYCRNNIITGCVFTDMDGYSAIALKEDTQYDQTTIITNCHVTMASSASVAAAIILDCPALVHACYVKHQYATAGGCIQSTHIRLFVSNCTLISPYSGVLYQSPTSGTLEHIHIQNNYFDTARCMSCQVNGTAELRHFTVTGNVFDVQTSASFTNESAVYMVAASGATLHNALISDNSIESPNATSSAWRFGVVADHVKHLQIHNNVMRRVASGVVGRNNLHVDVIGNHIQDTEESIDSPFGVQSEIEGCGIALMQETGEDINHNYVNIQNNTIYNVENNGIIVKSFDTNDHDYMKGIISGNMIIGVTGFGVSAVSLSQCAINFNFITPNTTLTAGISVNTIGRQANGVGFSQIIGNAIDKTSYGTGTGVVGTITKGISVTAAYDGIIALNHIGNTSENNIHVVSGNNLIITGNFGEATETNAKSNIFFTQDTAALVFGNMTKVRDDATTYGIEANSATPTNTVVTNNYALLQGSKNGIGTNVTTNPQADGAVTATDGQDTPNWAI